MALTRVKKVPTTNLVQGSSFLTSVPVAAGDVLQRVSSQVYTYSGSGAASNWDGTGNITETTAWNSASLTPLLQLSITAKRANSKFAIDLNGRFYVSNGTRSALSLSDDYSAGSANSSAGHIIYQTHYGIYHDGVTDVWHPGAYRADDTRGTLAAGASRIYYWFGGSIGGTQKYWGLNMSITEIAT